MTARKQKSARKRKIEAEAARVKRVAATKTRVTKVVTSAIETLKPGHIQIPLIKVLTLVHNMMEPNADKRVGPELLAEYVGHFTQKDVDDFVMGVVRKLSGYSLADGLRIADNLTRWRNSYFDATEAA